MDALEHYREGEKLLAEAAQPGPHPYTKTTAVATRAVGHLLASIAATLATRPQPLDLKQYTPREGVPPREWGQHLEAIALQQ